MFVVNDGSNFAKCNVPEIPFVIAVQDIDLATSASRSDLEGTVSIRDHGCHISASVLLLDSIFRSDLQSIGKYVNMENVVDRRRSDLIIGFNEVKKSALPAGTYVVSISGSAPSLFAVTSKETCNDVASDMVYAFSDNGVSASNIIANSSSSGAVMIH